MTFAALATCDLVPEDCTEVVMKRFVLISLIVVVVVIAGAAIFVRQYLRSERVVTQVTERVEALYGGQARVGSVDVGVSTSALHNFELFEAGSDGGDRTPWLKVESLAANVSLWDL